MPEADLLNALCLLETFKLKYEELLEKVDRNVFDVEFTTSLRLLSQDYLKKAVLIIEKYLDIFEKICRWNNISLGEKEKAKSGFDALSAAKSKLVMNLAKIADSKPVADAIGLIKPIAHESWPGLKSVLLKKVLPIQALELSKFA